MLLINIQTMVKKKKKFSFSPFCAVFFFFFSGCARFFYFLLYPKIFPALRVLCLCRLARVDQLPAPTFTHPQLIPTNQHTLLHCLKGLARDQDPCQFVLEHGRCPTGSCFWDFCCTFLGFLFLTVPFFPYLQPCLLHSVFPVTFQPFLPQSDNCLSNQQILF